MNFLSLPLNFGGTLQQESHTRPMLQLTYDLRPIDLQILNFGGTLHQESHTWPMIQLTSDVINLQKDFIHNRASSNCRSQVCYCFALALEADRIRA